MKPIEPGAPRLRLVKGEGSGFRCGATNENHPRHGVLYCGHAAGHAGRHEWLTEAELEARFYGATEP